MSVHDLIEESVSLFESNNIDEAITKLNLAWGKIKDKKKYLQEQSDIQFWLGRCYLEQAMKVKDITEAKDLFAKAIDQHYKQQLHLAEQLTDEQTRPVCRRLAACRRTG